MRAMLIVLIAASAVAACAEGARDDMYSVTYVDAVTSEAEGR